MMSTVEEVRVTSPNRCWTLDKRGDRNWWNLRDVYRITWRVSTIDTTRAMEGSTSSALTLGCVLGNSPPSDIALAVILVRVVDMTVAIISPAVNSSSSSGSYTKCSSATISSGTTSATWTSSGPSVGSPLDLQSDHQRIVRHHCVAAHKPQCPVTRYPHDTSFVTITIFIWVPVWVLAVSTTLSSPTMNLARVLTILVNLLF